MRHDDGSDAGRGRRLPRVHLGGDLLPVGQPPPLLLLEIQRAGPQGPHAQGRTDGQTDGRADNSDSFSDWSESNFKLGSPQGPQISKVVCVYATMVENNCLLSFSLILKMLAPNLKP